VSEYLSDKEQWEQIRAWVRDNGLSVIVAVAVVLAAFQGWRWWQARLDARGIGASAAYGRVIESLEKGDRTEGFTRLGELEREYPGSPYADQGKLLAARVYVEGNELDKAARELETVATGSKDHELALVARLRLARVEVAQGKPDAALTTLNAVKPGAFAPRYAEVRGDIYFARGDKAQALKEYRSALDGAVGDTALLNLKIADLAAEQQATAAANSSAAPAHPAAAAATATK
jgi:predicted negative regulator of RcsB-dependent stress response